MPDRFDRFTTSDSGVNRFDRAEQDMFIESWQEPLSLNRNVAHSNADQFLPGLEIYEVPASQAIEPMPPLGDALLADPYDSSVKLNLQITNVPEVSQPVKLEAALRHVNHAFEIGAQAVRPIEEWMATSNAVTDALVGLGPQLDNAVNYYANTPARKVIQDATDALGQISDAIDRSFSYPHTPEERAKASGELMPFADGIGTQGGSATFKVADAVATHVDRALMQSVRQSLEAIKRAPDLASDIKHGLYEFLKSKRLTSQQLEYAGVPRGFFDDIQREEAKDASFFAMSKLDDSAENVRRRKAHPDGNIPKSESIAEHVRFVESEEVFEKVCDEMAVSSRRTGREYCLIKRPDGRLEVLEGSPDRMIFFERIDESIAHTHLNRSFDLSKHDKDTLRALKQDSTVIIDAHTGEFKRVSL